MPSNRSESSKTGILRIVGVLVLMLLAAYFIYEFISYMGKTSYSFYEVEEGSLVRENSYEGIILRKETVINSGSSGYINFYIADTQKAAVGSRVYSIDKTGDLQNFLASHTEELNGISSSKVQSIRKTVINASRNFDPMDFQSSSLLLDSLTASVLEFTDSEAMTALEDELKAAGIVFTEYRSDSTGYISYNIDGYEPLTRSDLTAAHFDRTSYQRVRHRTGDLVAENDPICKLITDESWEIIFPMSEEDISLFSESKSLKINFKDKDISTTADFTMFRSAEGNAYGALSLKRYLVQFISDRFVNFEIETNHVTGLKIPEKSILEKSFYLIPSDYRKKDSRGNYGFYKETLTEDGTGYTFIVADVYCDDGTSCYVNLPSSGELSEGDYVADPDDPGKRYQIGPMGVLKGVYNINKGYAVFKRIEELERANGYCIVKKGTSYGLNLYDHIILDSEEIEEGQVLY